MGSSMESGAGLEQSGDIDFPEPFFCLAYVIATASGSTAS